MGMGGGGGGTADAEFQKKNQKRQHDDQEKRFAAEGKDGKNLYWHTPTYDPGLSPVLRSERAIADPFETTEEEPAPTAKSGKQNSLLR